MSNDIVNYVADTAEAILGEGYCICKGLVYTLYKKHIEAYKAGVCKYLDDRFIIRLENFNFEEEKISDNEKKKFFDSIDQKKLDILLKLLEEARISTYDLHAKILSKLYGNFLKNCKLNYYEHALLANISTLSESDFLYFHKLIKNGAKSPLKTKDECEYTAISKFLQIGILSKSQITHLGEDGDGAFPLDFKTNDFSLWLLGVIDESIKE